MRGKISKCAALALFKDRMIILGNMPKLEEDRRKQPAACQLQISND